MYSFFFVSGRGGSRGRDNRDGGGDNDDAWGDAPESSNTDSWGTSDGDFRGRGNGKTNVYNLALLKCMPPVES